MSGDYSRFPFDPSLDFAGVRLQQGRPLTDWDWNDFVAEVNRRQQAGTADTFGQAVVPTTTADGFKISVSDGALTIGRGRIYVDGLLAECHGLPPAAWDPMLAESYGTSPVPYDQQPYLPGPDALPTSGGPHIVFVDVWQREVSAIERPELVEKAVGVDTTTRLQTVWQVKVLENVGAGVSCGTALDDVQAWKDLVAPSGGRLTTGTGEVAGDPDPCKIPPAGGYKGLENQLYRVEMHAKGGLGAATFKWSRDNGSIETRVVRLVGQSQLIVESTGKDGVLRFNDGDWIELTDDWRELAGKPGELHKIKVGGGVDDATRTITLEKPIAAPADFPVDGQGNLAPERHTRIKRWDQKGKVLRGDGTTWVDLDDPASTGDIQVPPDGKPLLLEAGVLVTFSVEPSGEFHVGDFWMFAARTADASVETLTAAPPQGIHHHYAKLAVWSPPGTPEDCRVHWPLPAGGESCACTVCVTPEQHAAGTPSLQQAIDGVKATGGVVCLTAGEYHLGQPVRIDGAKSLQIVGRGPATQITADGAGFLLARGSDVALLDFALSAGSSGEGAFAAIAATDMNGLRVERLSVQESGKRDLGAGVALNGRTTRAVVRDNSFKTPIGLTFGLALGEDGQLKDEAVGGVALDLDVLGNGFLCAGRGIDLRGGKTQDFAARVDGNIFGHCAQVGINLDAPAGLIGSPVMVTDNRMIVSGHGVIANTFGLTLSGNLIAHVGATTAPENGVTLTGVGDWQVTNNRIVAFGGGVGIGLDVRANAVTIASNLVELCAEGIAFKPTSTAQTVVVEANHVLDTLAVGLYVWGAATLTVARNVVARVALLAPGSSGVTAVGVFVAGCNAVAISGNQLTDIGAAAGFTGSCIGIFVSPAFDDVVVADNIVRRSSITGDADSSAWVGLLVGGAGEKAPPSSGRTDSTFEGRFPEVVHKLKLSFDTAADAAPAEPASSRKAAAPAAATPPVPTSRGRLTVNANQVVARGSAPAVWILVQVDCVFVANQCLQQAPDAQGNASADVLINARTIIFGNNHIEGGPTSARLIAAGEKRPLATVVGNIASGALHLNGVAIPNNPPLNIIGL